MTAPTVLYLVPDLYGPPGGIARLSRDVARALREDGACVSVVALHDRPDGGIRDPEPGIDYHPCGGSRARFVATSLRLLLSRPSLVLAGHVHLLPPVLLPARALGVPVAVFAYGVEVWDRLPPLRGWALRHADRILAISDYTVRRAAETNTIERDRIRLVHCTLGDDVPDSGPSPAPDGSQHLLSVSRLSRDEGYKGHRQVLAALPAVLAQHPGVIYDVVGDGDDRAALEEEARERGLQDVVRFHGRVSDEQLAELYAGATLFVLPSSGEGFGIVFLEAMAHGLPVVGGNRDATPEVVADGECGLLIDPDDTQALSAAISTLLADDTLRQRFAVAARRRVAEYFKFSAFRRQLRESLVGLGPRLLDGRPS